VPSRSDSARLVACAVLVTAALSGGTAALQPERAAPQARPTADEIARALKQVQADPNLATEQTISTLRFKEKEAERPAGPPAWLRWITGLFSWIGKTMRVLIWVVAAGLVVALVAYLVHLTRIRREAALGAEFIAPTHVRDLDIRPETLPADIGAAARALWDRGEHRAALALLYRGLLSRLAHVHRVPIRDSTTEGDCVALAADHLASPASEYAARLVGVWQRAVYAHDLAAATTVHELCDGFAAALGHASRSDSTLAGSGA
jgi:hypothetical protein